MRNNQSGRSMVEVLGALAIVGLLSLIALGGYRIAMDRRQANDLIHTEQMLAIEIISGLVIGMENPITSYHSPYVYSVDLFGGEAFAIQFPDIDESVCRVVLNKVGNKMVLAVNETLYAGNNDICTDKNVIQFRHNTHADTPETTCKPACGAEELCVEGTCCPKAHACGTQCCGADNNGVHLLCQGGRCVCPGDMTLNEGVCACVPSADTHCAESVFVGGMCICQMCEAGYVLNEVNQCEANACPENASKGGTGDETDVAGCRCNADTPTWTGTECVGATCAIRMLDALVAAGRGDRETLKNNFDTLSGNSVHYQGYLEFKQDMDLSECALTIDGHFYAEGNTVRLNRLTVQTRQQAIGINLKDANLYVSGDIAGTSEKNDGVRLVGSTIEATNLTGVSTKSSGIHNESSSVITVGTLTGSSTKSIGIQNAGDSVINAGTLTGSSTKSIGIQNADGGVINAGTLTAQNTGGHAIGLSNEGTIQATTISASSAASYGMSNNGTITADGTVTGISAGKVDGVNNNSTITAATIYYCPSYWGRTFSPVPVCAPGCARGTCQ